MITGDSLRDIPLFHAVPGDERETIASHAADVRLRPDEWVLHEGETPAFHVVIDGSLAAFKNVGGHEQQVNTYKAGDFFGEVPLLLGSSALVSVRSTSPSRLMRLAADDFHALVQGCPKLNAEIMRTMATRVGMLQQLAVRAPLARVTVTGPRLDPACYEMRDFLVRNHVAFRWVEPHEHAQPAKWPLVRVSEGEALECPTIRDVAERVGLQTRPNREEYDVVVVGGGPAGLAAAVYGASEGLCTLLVERVAAGGQAGTSSRIENYLGFPSGISGDELSLRARDQAKRFDAELVITRTCEEVVATADGYDICLDGGECVRTASIVLANGVEWRRLDVPGIDRFLGRGVYYGAAQTEANSVRGQPVFLVGGGNSAGQAAMLFSSYAEQVTLLVRGPTLADSMSQYLIDQLATKRNVTIETRSEVTTVDGDDCLRNLNVRNHVTGETTQRACAGLFVFIGARPMTEWLPPSVIRDQWQYVCTGRDVMDLLKENIGATWPLERDPYLLETSAPGVFAVGDVRHGSMKRVASAVGEGSMAIAFVHQYLAERRQRAEAATAR